MAHIKKRGFRFIEHTADVIIEAWAPSLEGAFEEAAKGVYEVMVDLKDVEPIIERNIEVQGFDLENLLLRWLEELIILTDSEGLIFSEFKVEKICGEEENYYLTGRCWGEKMDPSKHNLKTHVKAITYSLMRIWQENGLWKVRFTIDI